jgi:regulation of enolase protein 1 (concanavalin A-like superfamily)
MDKGYEAFGRQMAWLNPPASGRFDAGKLCVTTREKTDFWRETFYGFWRDNGHFLFERAGSDFTLEVAITAKYQELYDQAGLMVRLSESHWIKTGIEYTDKKLHFSTVVTNNASDWSIIEIPSDIDTVRVRLVRYRDSIRTYFQVDVNSKWLLARVAYFPRSEIIDVGLTCCSPERGGFTAYFENYSLQTKVHEGLHN